MGENESNNYLLLLSSVKNIMKSNPDVSNISSDAIFLIAKGAEEFVAFLARQALRASSNKKLLGYDDLAKVVDEIENLDFLKEIFPTKPKLPLEKVKKIMKCSPDVTNFSKESSYIISKAAEGLVSFLVRQALEASENKMLVDYNDLAKVVADNESLEFLRDTIPPKIKGHEYLDILKEIEEQEKKRELEDQEL